MSTSNIRGLDRVRFIGLKPLTINKYISVRENNAITINCTAAKLFETIEISKSCSVPGTIVFKSAHNKYLSTTIDGKVSWDKESVGQLESFVPESFDNNVYAFKTIYGKYLSVESSFFYGPYLTCNKEIVYQACQFYVEGLDLTHCHTFKSIRNEMMWKDYGMYVGCSSNYRKTCESFEFVNLDSGKVALKSYRGKFLSAEDDSMLCSKNTPGEHEVFEIIRLDESSNDTACDMPPSSEKVMIKTWDGKYIYEQGGCLVPSEKDIPNSTRHFIMEDIFINKNN